MDFLYELFSMNKKQEFEIEIIMKKNLMTQKLTMKSVFHCIILFILNRIFILNIEYCHRDSKGE